jgi:hypothetical protein
MPADGEDERGGVNATVIVRYGVTCLVEVKQRI